MVTYDDIGQQQEKDPKLFYATNDSGSNFMKSGVNNEVKQESVNFRSNLSLNL